MGKINKILVANRGEIALRVMRSAKEMGILTVAIFSEADRNALHVRYADEAVCIGGPKSSDSYLCGDKIIDRCKRLNVDAIHPGYGFLSENAAFAQKVQDAGIIFIGPSPKAIELMGNKLAAKAAAASYNIPMVPGTEQAVTSLAEAKEIAQKIGFPILIKASAGGGGKGMRVVEKLEQLEEQMHLAANEAAAAFGDSSVFIEKYIYSPRHIEIQVLGDTHGNILHLFERECSIQRRHQKVIEEAPSSLLTPDLRQQMGLSAVNIAKACDYVGAGTVEFLVDEYLNYYFLEMNTRLQVEHPVTEQITGIDLVKEQITIAEGKEISFKQEQLEIKGHALELRVYAEDPANNFLPDIGKLETYVRPQGLGIRVDDGFEQGMDIPIYYDPMISKLISFGKNREEAIAKMLRAIDEYRITGIETTLPFGKYVLQHESFISGSFDTKFIERYFNPDDLKTSVTPETEEIAAVLAAVLLEKQKPMVAETLTEAPLSSNWRKNRI